MGLEQIVDYISGRTGFSDGEITVVVKELRDAIFFFALPGQGSKIDGLGTFHPKVKIDGRFDLTPRLDLKIRQHLNRPGAFNGDIENRENIGKTGDDLVAL